MFELANRFPPFICRYVARKKHGNEPKSHSDLARESKLSRSYVAVLSRKRTWKGIPIDVVERFSSACGVNLMAPSKTREFLKRAKKEHLQNASGAQRKFIFSLFKPK